MSRNQDASVGAVSVRSDSRLRVLDVIRESSGGCGGQHLAERTGLHPNTVRFHLERLEEDGLASRQIRRHGEPGRPPLTYTATPRPDAHRDHREFRQLAGVLAQTIVRTSEDPAAAATEAGRSWGLGVATRHPSSGERANAAEAVDVLVETLETVGFAPELAVVGGGRAVVLQRHCPFLEIAESQQDVVCSVHLGFMHGVLEQLSTPVTADRLVPFASPRGCEAHLSGYVEA